jgi:hypothetical protein
MAAQPNQLSPRPIIPSSVWTRTQIRVARDRRRMVSILVIFKARCSFQRQSFGRVRSGRRSECHLTRRDVVETGLAGKQVSGVLRRQTRGLNYPNSALVLYGICSVPPKMCGSGFRRP